MENLKYNENIPQYIKKRSGLETCHDLIELQNIIKTINIIKSIPSSKKFMSFDTEQYEKNQDLLIELGYTIFDINGIIEKKKHYIIQDYLAFHNEKHVEDNKFNYNFGESETKSLSEVITIFNNELRSVNYIVGQGIINDIISLEKIGISLTRFNKMNGIYKENAIIDTQDLYSGNFHEKPISLKRGLEKFNISYRNLHNAGNDAYYTMKYFFKLIKNFDINDIKYQRILNVKIPDEYSEQNYLTHMKEKKIKRKREKELKKLQKNRNNYRDNNYNNDDDWYDYDDEDNYYDDSHMGICDMLGIYDSDELDEYIAVNGFY